MIYSLKFLLIIFWLINQFLCFCSNCFLELNFIPIKCEKHANQLYLYCQSTFLRVDSVHPPGGSLTQGGNAGGCSSMRLIAPLIAPNLECVTEVCWVGYECVFWWYCLYPRRNSRKQNRQYWFSCLTDTQWEKERGLTKHCINTLHGQMWTHEYYTHICLLNIRRGNHKIPEAIDNTAVGCSCRICC